MPRVDSDIKLDFKDVLLRPKRSTLRSRADVSSSHTLPVPVVCVCVCGDHVRVFPCIKVILEREFVFKNSKKSYKGIPVIAANMDTVGTFEMAVALAKVTNQFICRLFFIVFSPSLSPPSLLFLSSTHTPSIPLFLHCSFAVLSGIYSLHHIPPIPDLPLLSSFIPSRVTTVTTINHV